MLLEGSRSSVSSYAVLLVCTGCNNKSGAHVGITFIYAAAWLGHFRKVSSDQDLKNEDRCCEGAARWAGRKRGLAQLAIAAEFG